MLEDGKAYTLKEVALLAEGVDRNFLVSITLTSVVPVALLAEGVDRNVSSRRRPPAAPGRPPRGGRG